MKKLLPLLLASFCLPLSAAAPAPVNWSADATKSTLEFAFMQAGAQTTGRFGKFTALVDFAPADLARARFDVAIDIASADTRDAERDAQLRTADLFDTAKFPKAQFVVTQFSAKAAAFEGRGKLTLRGVTRDVPISFTFAPATEAGQSVAWLKGSGTIKRLEFGVGQGEWKSTEWVSNDVRVMFNLRLVPRTVTAPAAVPAATGKPNKPAAQ